MSRIGKMPVALPKGVNISIDGSTVKVKGPKGELSRTFHQDMALKQENGIVSVQAPEDPAYNAMHGLTRALLNNMVKGVSDGFIKTLEIEGVGYRGELQGKNLVLALGFSHPVPVEPPDGITFTVDKSQRIITIEGPDKQMVGQVAANIRSLRPPEPYKGKGIHYQGEKVRRKAGKAGKAGGK
ncbi:MAG: 50S ribosomal protein L6 [Chloroflexi bacterium UTCFX4]|jgi:large subunit ribosomal protein L6|nr:MAG: 50S ribosomal protein L6 [Chloroflexi bacterium UTCFX4]